MFCRNRLGNEKASKLTRIFKTLNSSSKLKTNGLNWIWNKADAEEAQLFVTELDKEENLNNEGDEILVHDHDH